MNLLYHKIGYACNDGNYQQMLKFILANNEHHLSHLIHMYISNAVWPFEKRGPSLNAFIAHI